MRLERDFTKDNKNKNIRSFIFIKRGNSYIQTISEVHTNVLVSSQREKESDILMAGNYSSN